MPWTLKDVDSHYKGLTAAQKAQWLAVANNALAACQKKGGTNCDASAIQQANGVVNKNKKTEAQLEAASIIVEVGRSISAANGSKIDAALKLMASAMETINTLINDTQQEALINVGSEAAPIMLTSKYAAWETWSFDEASKILAKSDSFDSRRLSVQGALRRRALADYATQKLNDMSSGSDGGDYYDMYDCGPMPWIRDLYDDYVVYSLGSELYQSGYTINGTDVTLDDPVDVQISYVPKPTTTNNESIIPLLGEIIVLEEKAVSSDGKVQVKLISPGWGSSGYYSAKMLERDGPKVFKKGLHMYMNHPTEEEDRNRPERDLRDLVGVQEEDAKWLPNGPTGPGLYATASVFSPYREFIDEAAPFIGTSIRAGGRAVEGEAEGRHGHIVESLEEGYSVDYVTLPGRGGQVLPLLEAARSRLSQEAAKTMTTHRSDSVDTTKLLNIEVKEVDEAEAQALRESVTRLTETNTTMSETLMRANESIARLNERLMLSDARTIVSSTLAAIAMNDMTRARLTESCSANPPTKDGVLDTEALIERVKESAKTELEYLAVVAPSASGGSVSGMGVTSQSVSEADIDTILNESFDSIFGGDKKLAEVAAKGRN